MQRCQWAENASEKMKLYHDTEWGKIERNEQALFELLTLEGFQTGLSWSLILDRREALKSAFLDYDIHRLAVLTDRELDRLLDAPGMLRNRLKIYSVRSNAKALLELKKTGTDLGSYLWSFDKNFPHSLGRSRFDPPVCETPLSKKIAQDMKRQGFKFVGPKIIYSLMQASGLINDHEKECALSGKRCTEEDSNL